MFRIKLINMPFASVGQPSIGITQLQSVLERKFGRAIAIDILNLNQDFALYMGLQIYDSISIDVDHLTSGLGDWIFRKIAFPELEDNEDRYIRRFYPYRDPITQAFKQTIIEKRAGVGMLLDQLIDRYTIEDADMIGFTSMFAQNSASFALANKLKQRNPQQIIVIGGANCEAPMGLEIIKQIPSIDYVFSGAALESFPRLIEMLLHDDLAGANAIHGLLSKTNYKHLETQAQLNGPAMAGLYGDELDINTAVQLDYEPFLQLFDAKFSHIAEKPELALPFETSRGCWWGQRAHCTFCGLNGTGMNYRSMRPDLAVEYIQSLFKYADRCKYFRSVDNIIPKSFAKEVLPLLDVPSDIEIFYEVKADLSEDDVRALARARVMRIQPGIEALATSTLKLMRKGVSAFQNLRLLQYCSLYNVYPYWNLLIGFPGEIEDTYSKYMQDLPLLSHLPPPTGVYPIRFDRYSPYFEQQGAYGLDLKPMDFYEYIYPFGADSLQTIAYFFSDRKIDAPHRVLTAKWLRKLRDRIDAWISRWNDQGQLFPKLYVKAGDSARIIYDSRSGQEHEFDIGITGAQLLEMIARPRKIADLAAELPGVCVADELARLAEQRLIFQEDDRVMSLVLPREPAMSYQTPR